MAACLRSRFLAMSRSSAPSSASTSLNASAMARCSGGGGSGIGNLAELLRLTCLLVALPVCSLQESLSGSSRVEVVSQIVSCNLGREADDRYESLIVKVDLAPRANRRSASVADQPVLVMSKSSRSSRLLADVDSCRDLANMNCRPSSMSNRPSHECADVATSAWTLPCDAHGVSDAVRNA